MKRVFALLSAFVFIFLSCISFNPSALADNGTVEDQGLYTIIPYVPEYSGNLSSQTRVLLIDLETGNAIIEQNGDVRAYPASTTKIMTAVLLIENTADDEWDTPVEALKEVNSSVSATGSQFGLIVGDCPTRRDLLYGLMLPSGCDCAYVVSNLIAGSETDFVLMMNIRASEIGMNNTGYENSYGVASNGHYTTAEDLATLVRHAMQYELFRKVVSTENKTLSFYNSALGRKRTIVTKNTNHLICHDSSDYYKYAIGVKTGTTEMAAYCLTSAARNNGLELAAIVMNSEGNSERYGFSKEMLEWGFRYYASEGGYYSMNITNALFRASAGGCMVYDVPETGSEGKAVAELAEGLGVRVGAYRTDEGGNIWYMVWHNGSFDWAKAEQLEFVAYVNDIRIDEGAALRGVHVQGEDPDINGVIASRHLVKAVTVTVYDQNGQPVTGGSNYPAASCTHSLFGTTVDRDVDLSILAPGTYECITKVEAVAYVPTAPSREYYISEEKSVIVISESAESSEQQCTYCYNSNTGERAPEGGVVKKGETFEINIKTPVKAGCRFAGWNTKADGTGKAYAPGETVTADSSIILYAVWEKGNDEWFTSIEPSFVDGNLVINGNLSNEAGITAVKLNLSAIGDSGSEPVFIQTEYCCTNSYDFDDLNKKLKEINLANGEYQLTLSAARAQYGFETLYDYRIQNDTVNYYHVTFDPNGGKIVSGKASLEMTTGQLFPSVPKAEKTGANFEGWFDSNGDPIGIGSPLPASDSNEIVIKARWSDGSDGGTIIIHQHTGLAAVPWWILVCGGALLLALIIGLIIIILRKPDRN